LTHALAVVDTHLKWDAPGTPLGAQRGYRQIRELLDARATFVPRCPSWIIVGDFNDTADSPVVRSVRSAGFVDAYQDQAMAFTCNPNGRAKRIDYLFHTPDLCSQVIRLPRIDDHTPLPFREEPSDHLAVMAHFDWTGV
jgi:endonuclease/exonuclease/phosphatase (EEP) superfamily protein YafD